MAVVAMLVAVAQVARAEADAVAAVIFHVELALVEELAPVADGGLARLMILALVALLSL